MNVSEMSIDMIPQMSSVMKTQAVMEKVGEAMLGKTLDTAQKSSADMVNMFRSSMERSVNPGVGGNIDVYA